jgi:hypothetical protein
MSGCGTVVHSRTIRMVRSVGVFSGGCVMVIGIVGVTTLHPHGMGRPELPLLFMVLSSLSVDSLRTMCSDGDLV